MGILVSGCIMDCPYGARGRGLGLCSHIEGSEQTICRMTSGMMGDTNVAVVGLVLMIVVPVHGHIPMVLAAGLSVECTLLVVEDIHHCLFCGPRPWQIHIGQRRGLHFTQGLVVECGG
jgi:hypothetical protein